MITTQTITNDTPLCQVTAGQLAEYLNGVLCAQPRFVYGIEGIRRLFNVSGVTARRYKNTILKDAISQQGRTIITDVDKALELYAAAGNYNSQTVLL